MLHGSALSFCLRIHQVIRPGDKLKPIKHSIPSSFLHSLYFSFFFLSLSPLPFQSPTGIGFMFHFLRIRCFWLSHTWLPVKIILARSLFMVIRFLPFCPCLQSEIDGLYQNIYSQTFIEQDQEWNTKGTVHEIPGIFFCLNCVCIYYCCRQPENFPGIWFFFSYVSNIKSVM